jgi:uncharacterized repeat protein (TIGR03833 family)
MIEQTVDIKAADGQMDTLLCHPERGGPYPAMCVLMEAHSIREELQDMARRLATVGDDVLLPNLYDRERGQRSGHSHTARVEEQVDESLAHWTTALRVLITGDLERMTTRAAGNRYAQVKLEATGMDGKHRQDITPGLRVNITQKRDQRSGKLTGGIVKDVLTKSAYHPHGIKVRLDTGEVGRVQEVVETSHEAAEWSRPDSRP